MKKFWIAGVAFLLVCSFGFWLYRISIPDETRIRWVLEAMAEGFNDSSARRTVDGLADDFVEESTGASKSEIKGFLFQLDLTERDARTKEFRYRAELSEIEIQLPPGERRASARLFVDVLRLKGDGWSKAWKARVETALVKEKGGWKVTGGRFLTVEGKRPF